MSGLLKFLLFCILAVAAGVAAVSVPIDGKTAAEHVQALLDDGGGRPSTPPPTSRPDQKPVAAQRKAAARKTPAAAPDPGDDHPTEEDRKALDELIGKRVR